MNKTLKYGLFLLVLGVIVAGLFAIVNSITAPIIAENELKEVLPMLEDIDEDNDEFKDVTEDYEELPISILKIFAGYKDGKNNSIIYWTSTIGYGGGEINVLTAIDVNSNQVIDTIVTGAVAQTAGIGDKIFDFDFDVAGNPVVNYANINVDTAVGSGDLAVISGATISVKGVYSGIIIASTHFVENFETSDDVDEEPTIEYILKEVDSGSDDFVEITDEFTDLSENILKVFNGKTNDEVNSVIYLTSTPGYRGGLVEILTAIDVETNLILGVVVTDATSQTPNLGDVIVDHDFDTIGKDANIYADLSVEDSIPEELEAITGATASVKAYYRGLIAATNHFVYEYLEAGLGE